MNTYRKLLLPALTILSLVYGCNLSGNSDKQDEEKVLLQTTDSTAISSAATEQEQPPVADPILTAYSKLYAGVCADDSLHLSSYQLSVWKAYSDALKGRMATSKKKMYALDTLSRSEFADINAKTKTVFYPFGGPDLFYPLSIFPDADTYCITGLEPAGTIINRLLGKGTDYSSFLQAQRNFLSLGYFITSQMMEDLHRKDINGTAPLFSMQLGAMGYSIESASYEYLSKNGELIDTTAATNMVKFKVFKEGDTKSKTIIYIRTNLQDGQIPDNFLKYISKQEQGSTSVFVKAASYLLFSFKTIRNHILTHSCAIIQDDTGVPFRYIDNEDWNVTLYGQYMHPLKVFGEYCYQRDLEKAFRERGPHKLPVRIGYNSVSNLIVARKNK